ncbi:MAG: hypothetical protein ACK4YP_26635, partial [Myxococcota bacterium]
AVALPGAWGLGKAPLPAPARDAKLLVRVAHPLVAKLAALPPAIGGPLLAHAARVDAGLPTGAAAVADTIAAVLGREAPSKATGTAAGAEAGAK